MAKRSKYNNVKVHIDGHKFDSKKEANYYLILRGELNAGRVKRLEFQPKFRLEVNGILICHYIADFKVFYANGKVEIIDVKGFRTPTYKLKNRMMKAILGIDIKEI